jgi:hypothetical protein
MAIKEQDLTAKLRELEAALAKERAKNLGLAHTLAKANIVERKILVEYVDSNMCAIGCLPGSQTETRLKAQGCVPLHKALENRKKAAKKAASAR